MKAITLAAMRGTQALFSLPAAIAVRVLHPPPAGRVTRRQATASREPRVERLKELVKFPGKRR
jgi:hypothetical protein